MIGPPSVSVITPTKNRLQLLTETMDSAAKQTFEAWEHIIVDDGSDDGTADEVKARAASDSRVRYVQRTGTIAGANVCRNIGISQSRAELLVFLDSDDLLAPECLARRVAIMDHNRDLDFATFQTGVFQNTPGDLGRQFNAEILGDDLLRFLLFECPWQTTAPTWRKRALQRIGSFDESLLSWQDIELHVRAIAGGLHYVRFAEVDHYMRWQNETTKTSIEQRRSPVHLEAAHAVFEKLEQHVRRGPGMNWVRQRALCSLYFFLAEQWVASGRLSTAFESWKRIRRRELSSDLLYISGVILLAVLALDCQSGSMPDRVVNRWKGWMRLRTNPALVRLDRNENPVFMSLPR